jgi:hypothetical protein
MPNTNLNPAIANQITKTNNTFSAITPMANDPAKAVIVINTKLSVAAPKKH